MEEDAAGRANGFFNRWRVAGWGGALVLLLLPLVAMRFTAEVAWTGLDFAVFGAMLAMAGLGLEATFGAVARPPLRRAMAAGIVVLFVLTWAILATG